MTDRFVVLSGCSGGGKSTLLAELAAEGRTVLLSTHRVLDPDRIDRQLHVRDRRLVAETAAESGPAPVPSAGWAV